MFWGCVLFLRIPSDFFGFEQSLHRLIDFCVCTAWIARQSIWSRFQKLNMPFFTWRMLGGVTPAPKYDSLYMPPVGTQLLIKQNIYFVQFLRPKTRRSGAKFAWRANIWWLHVIFAEKLALGRGECQKSGIIWANVHMNVRSCISIFFQVYQRTVVTRNVYITLSKYTLRVHSHAAV